jgi:[ribosomal protein S5]-alanine N-acetyltransferase
MKEAVIETQRLRLRRLCDDDAAFIRELVNDPAFIRYIGDKGVRNDADAVAYIRNGPIASYEKFGFGLYAVELRDTGQPIGMCGLLKRDTLPDADLGFAFRPQFRGRGFAAESALAVVRYARETLGLKRILAITTPDNVNSIRVLERAGMRFEKMVELNSGEPELKLFGLHLSEAS